MVSNRLTDSPCCVVSGQFGWTANMERIMKAQALNDTSMQSYMIGKKNLEINPHHAIIKNLKEKMEDEEQKKIAHDLVVLLYETSCINSGYTLENPASFSNIIYNMVQLGLGIDEDDDNEIDNNIESETVSTEDNMEDNMENVD